MPLNPKVTLGQQVVRRDPFSMGDWLSVVVRVVRGTGEKNLSMMAAAIAFFAMLALFPALTATISLYGYVSDPRVVQENIGLLAPVLPEQVFDLVNQRVTALVTAERQKLGLASLVSLLVAVWSARAGITAMIAGLNVICDQHSARGFLQDLLVAYALTVLLILVTLVALGTVVIVPAILNFMPLVGQGAVILDVVRWAVAMVSVALGIGTLYRFGPGRRLGRWPLISIGTLLATVLWIAVSFLLSLYIRNFANYDEVYGSLGAVIALLMWFYLSAFVVLLGAELNAQIENVAANQLRQRRPEFAAASDG